MSERGELFQHILRGEPNAELEDQFPFYPLNAPGMAIPGTSFAAEAQRMEPEVPAFTAQGTGPGKHVVDYSRSLHYLYRRATYDENFTMPVNVRGNMVQAQIVPGHKLYDETNGLCGGPLRSNVMLIGKHPGREELAYRKNFVGPTSQDFTRALDELNIPPDIRAEWYVTNLVKWTQLDRQSDGLAKGWINDCRPILDQELRLVRPEFILCIGSEASKAILGTQYSVSTMVGRVVPFTIPIFERGETPQYHTAKVMAVTHPAAVYRRPELYDGFKAQLGLFYQLTQGADIGGAEKDLDHRAVYTEQALKRIVDDVRADPSRWMVAVDGEWHGECPTNAGAYLRTVQFATKHGEGVTVVLRHQGGLPAFQPSIEAAVTQLKRLLLPDEQTGYTPRVGGHFFRADLPWLIHAGIDLREQYAPSPDENDRTTGGWDTSLMYHATNESASYKLEDIATRLTTAPRYDVDLQDWKEAYCARHGLKASDMEGYGMCPDWILHPYGSYDADVTWRIAHACMKPGGLLDKDWNGCNSWRPYWVAHRASLAFLEMEMNGIVLDKARVDKLTATFMDVKTQLLASFRRDVGWDGTQQGRDGRVNPHDQFNPASFKHCVAVLFGDQFAYRQLPSGERIPVRPPSAVALNLTPIKTTGKRSKLWEDVLARGEASYYTPSTDKEVLGIIGHEHPLAMRLRDLKFVMQVLKSVLRPPTLDSATQESATDDEGNWEYEEGLASTVHDDGRIRTHLSQTKETGRASSYRPPLQNISKRREDDYARILGTDELLRKNAWGYHGVLQTPRYEHPIRTILRASPGCVLVEADFTGAELAVIAWLANDGPMIDHVRRNNLPEEDPQHYDIHAQTAVRVFNLPAVPTKTGLKNAGLKGMRVAAKNVNFGIPYGRSAEAISRQCREEGVDISVQDTQRIIDFYFQQYIGTGAFLANCRSRVHDPGWLCTAHGRYRRFIRTFDEGVVKEQERQAQNFPIQGTVADAMSRALDNLYYFRLERPDIPYRLLLQIHDAVLFEMPVSSLKAFKEVVIPTCMIHRNPIYPTYLDGTRMQGAGPYNFGADVEVYLNWGESITESQAEQLGVDYDLV